MPDQNDEQSLAQMADTFYNTLAKNRFFSSHNKAATSLEHLVGEVADLKSKIHEASQSSDRLSRSLNRMTLAAVVIAAVGIGLEAYKVFFGS